MHGERAGAQRQRGRQVVGAGWARRGGNGRSAAFFVGGQQHRFPGIDVDVRGVEVGGDAVLRQRRFFALAQADGDGTAQHFGAAAAADVAHIAHAAQRASVQRDVLVQRRVGRE